jgi:hypothetical protein
MSGKLRHAMQTKGPYEGFRPTFSGIADEPWLCSLPVIRMPTARKRSGPSVDERPGDRRARKIVSPCQNPALVKPLRFAMPHVSLFRQLHLAVGKCISISISTGLATQAQLRRRGETVASAIEQDRPVNEVQRAVAREAQTGRSTALSASTSAQAGLSLSTFFGQAICVGVRHLERRPHGAIQRRKPRPGGFFHQRNQLARRREVAGIGFSWPVGGARSIRARNLRG